jgi:hypothetical protein
MIIDIRGTHGSGKSWLMHTLLGYGCEEVVGHDPFKKVERTLGYVLPDWDTFVVGKYSNVCGGCDQIGSADEVVRRVRHYSQIHRHVLLEGILVAHTYQRYADLAREIESSQMSYVFCFLDTPLSKCIERVKARRSEAGNDKPLNPSNITKDHHNIWDTVRRKCKRDKLWVIEVPHEDPLPTIIGLLNGEVTRA